MSESRYTVGQIIPIESLNREGFCCIVTDVDEFGISIRARKSSSPINDEIDREHGEVTVEEFFAIQRKPPEEMTLEDWSKWCKIRREEGGSRWVKLMLEILEGIKAQGR